MFLFISIKLSLVGWTVQFLPVLTYFYFYLPAGYGKEYCFLQTHMYLFYQVPIIFLIVFSFSTWCYYVLGTVPSAFVTPTPLSKRQNNPRRRHGDGKQRAWAQS